MKLSSAFSLIFPGNGLGFDTAAVSQPCIHQSISNRKSETTTSVLDSIFSNVLLLFSSVHIRTAQPRNSAMPPEMIVDSRC